MKRVVRRALVVLGIVIALLGSSVPMAHAADVLCPFVSIDGDRYEFCIELL